MDKKSPFLNRRIREECWERRLSQGRLNELVNQELEKKGERRIWKGWIGHFLNTGSRTVIRKEIQEAIFKVLNIKSSEITALYEPDESSPEARGGTYVFKSDRDVMPLLKLIVQKRQIGPLSQSQLIELCRMDEICERNGASLAELISSVLGETS